MLGRGDVLTGDDHNAVVTGFWNKPETSAVSPGEQTPGCDESQQKLLAGGQRRARERSPETAPVSSTSPWIQLSSRMPGGAVRDVHLKDDYSHRKASFGSTRDARRAGR